MEGSIFSRILVSLVAFLVSSPAGYGRDVVTRFDAALADFFPDQSLVFKTIDATELMVNIYHPQTEPLPGRPAILWFHGGGWQSGFPGYLGPHAAYFAGLGYLNVTAEYRLAGSDGLTTFDCLEDARDAFYWMVENAESLGINPENIIVAGESAGGHLAGCIGTIPDSRTSGVPAPQPYPTATILINPITDITSPAIAWAMRTAGLAPTETALGESISPLFHIDSADPPTLLLHGASDGVVPPAQSDDFATGLQAVGKPAHLRLWEGKNHAFFLYLPEFSLKDKPAIQASLLEIEAFLQSLELNGYPAVHGHFSPMRMFAGPDGFRSFSSLTVVGDQLYGSTYTGGNSDNGLLFRMDPATREHVVLHEFSGTDGREPFNRLAVDGTTLYGVCKFGGTDNGGTLFSIQTDGSGFSVMHNFDKTTQEAYYPHAAPDPRG
jgi:acetyl esterase